jgi:hypothetical protein
MCSPSEQRLAGELAEPPAAPHQSKAPSNDMRNRPAGISHPRPPVKKIELHPLQPEDAARLNVAGSISAVQTRSLPSATQLIQTGS